MFYVNYSYQLALINLLLMVMMVLLAKPQYTFAAPQRNNVRRGIRLFFCLYILHSVFAFWSQDTYHSWEGFIAASRYVPFEIRGYEQIYNWLATAVGGNYFLWRACIWIPACLFMYYGAKRLDLLHRNFLVAVILFAGLTAYTRGMLGHTMLLFGVILLVDTNNNRFERFVGLLLFCGSYFFHKSMYVNILFALLAFYPLKKRGVVLSYWLFPFLTIAATFLINNIVSGAFSLSLGEGVGGIGDATAAYAAGEKKFANVYGMIGRLIRFIPEYMALFYVINRVVYKKYFAGIKRERVFVYLFRLSYVSIYIASLFYFVDTSSWIYERFKYMGFFPLPFVLAKVWSLEPETNRWIKSLILLQLFSLVFSWFTKIYNWYGL